MWEKSGDLKRSRMDPYTNDKSTFTTLFKAHVNLFTQSSLTFKRTLRLDGCVVVTIDDDEVIIVNISDTIEGENLTPTFHKLCTHEDCGSGGLDIQTSSVKSSADITSPSNTPRQDSLNDQNTTLSQSSDSVLLFLMPPPLLSTDHVSHGPNTEDQRETAALDQSAGTRLLASAAASNDQIESHEVGTTKSSLCSSPTELEECIRSVAPDQESSQGTSLLHQSHGSKTTCENTPPQTCLPLNNNTYKRKPMKRILVCPSKASSKAGLVNDSPALDVMNNRLCADRRSVNGKRPLSTDGTTKCKRRKKKNGLEHANHDGRSRHDERLNEENAEMTPPNVICANDDNCEFVNDVVDLRKDVVHAISNRFSCKGKDADDTSLRDSHNIQPVCLSAKSSTIHFQPAGISPPLKTLTSVSETCSSSAHCESIAEPGTASCSESTQLSPPSAMGSDNTALLTSVDAENATTPRNTENYIYTRAGRLYSSSTDNEITTVTPTPDKGETSVLLSPPLNSASTVNPGPTSSVNVGSSLSSVQLESTASSYSRSMADDTETTSVSQSDSNHAPPFLTPHEKICTELSRKIGDLDAKSDRLMKVLNKNKLDRENRSSLKRDFIKCMNAYSDAKESFISLKSLLLVPEKSNYSLLWLNDMEILERRIMKDLNTASDKLQRINEIYYKLVYNISPSVVNLRRLDKCVEYS